MQLKPYDGLNIDVWSLGVILYRIITRELPFKGKNFEEVKKQTLSGNFLVLYFLFLECQKLLIKLMTLNPSQRYHEGPLAQHGPGGRTEAVQQAALGCHGPPGNKNNEEH